MDHKCKASEIENHPRLPTILTLSILSQINIRGRNTKQ
jgi:hypothetical protein